VFNIVKARNKPGLAGNRFSAGESLLVLRDDPKVEVENLKSTLQAIFCILVPSGVVSRSKWVGPG